MANGKVFAFENAWSAYLGLILLTVGAFQVIEDAELRALLFTITALSAPLVMLAGIRRNAPSVRTPWRLLCAGLAVTTLACLPWYTLPVFLGNPPTSPSIADAMFVVSYAMFVVGAAWLIRLQVGPRERSEVLDRAIVFIGLGVLPFTLFIQPVLLHSKNGLVVSLVNVAYPTLDVLLIAQGIRMLLVSGLASVPKRLFIAWCAVQFATDMVYAEMILGGNFNFGAWWFGGYLISYGLLAASALHPDMGVLGDRVVAARRGGQCAAGRRRLVILLSAALVPTILVISQPLIGLRVNAQMMGVANMVLLVLTFFRIRNLMIDVGEREMLHRQSVELDQAKSDFMATVSHELRTPLTSIMGFTEMLLDLTEEPLSERQKKMLGMVDRNSGRLLALVEDILTLSNVEARNFTVEPEPMNLTALVRHVVERVEPAAGEKGLRLVVDSSPECPLVLGEISSLERVLLNLVNNAIKFSDGPGTVKIDLSYCDKHMMVTVEDDGIGIPFEEQDHLFARFFRSSFTRERAIQGTGLGLAVAKSIIEGHSGSISVRSAPDEGTAVSFTVPLAKP